MTRIAIVAGEQSGDALGGELIRALRRRYPDARFEGVGGSAMAREGLVGLQSMEALAVMGLSEVVRHLPRLWRLQRDLIRYFRREPPDVFVGIDSPDFNLGLERALRKLGIPTAHYVSPSVWAWRQGRIKGISQAVDRMLTLFPFEARFYQEHGVPVSFVGHPAADRFAMTPDVQGYRAGLGLPRQAPVLTVLPGSRRGELYRLGEVFLRAAAQLQRRLPGLIVVVPVAREALRPRVEAAVRASGVEATVTDGASEQAMGAADVVLTKSGTSTLEAMLLKRPMVVAYRVAPLTAWLVRRLGLVGVSHFALPNLLSGRAVVPEYIQEAVQAPALADALEALLTNPDAASELQECFAQQHEQLCRNASERAAEAVGDLIR